MINKEALKQILTDHEVKTTEDLQALMRELTREMIDAIYEGELTAHLGYEKHSQNGITDGNYRNGHGKKTVKSHLGAIELSPPRDRKGTFDPEIVRKRQTDISGLEAKVISMYGKGMSTRDIRDHIYEIYGYKLSAESISAITDKVIEKAREWQNRTLEPVYPIVFIDGIEINLKRDGTIKKAAVYLIIGINLSGKKTCLGLYVGENESSRLGGMTVMNELKNRGVQEILIFAVDNLTGLSEAITTVFPRAEIQKSRLGGISYAIHLSLSPGKSVRAWRLI